MMTVATISCLKLEKEQKKATRATKSMTKRTTKKTPTTCKKPNINSEAPSNATSGDQTSTALPKKDKKVNKDKDNDDGGYKKDNSDNDDKDNNQSNCKL